MSPGSLEEGRMEIHLRTLTPLWTGGVDQSSDRVHETGLMGSLRWWYETLVRGLGGYACDPTSDDRCPDNQGKHCAACELFGCTGWARKFRLRVLDSQGQTVRGSLGPDMDFKLQFLEIRPMMDKERWLFKSSVWTAAEYGAIGGKTPLKPQKKGGKVGGDYGIVRWISGPGPDVDCGQVRSYLQSSDWRQSGVELPDLRWFFFVKGAFLWRRQVNDLIGLADNGRRVIGHRDFQKFLRGERGKGNKPAVSKKIFSFRTNGGRVWGYARDGDMRNSIVRQIKQELGDGGYSVRTGEEVLDEL